MMLEKFNRAHEYVEKCEVIAKLYTSYELLWRDIVEIVFLQMCGEREILNKYKGKHKTNDDPTFYMVQLR